MGSISDEIIHEFLPYLRAYKSGRLERLVGTAVVPAGVDPITGVRSKDVVISAENGVSARLFLPKTPIAGEEKKFPILIYYHGGGFFIESPFSPIYHGFLNSLVAATNTLAISVDYRLAPEFPLPVGYDDSWAAVQWAAEHANNAGPEDWLNEYGDLNRVFLCGDSAGANIAHQMTIRVGLEKTEKIRVDGIVLIHPFFWGKDPIGSEAGTEGIMGKKYLDDLWMFVNPKSSGSDDPLLNPGTDRNLSELGCRRAAVFVAEKDTLRNRGWNYKELMGKSGWGGEVEVEETKGEGHVFFLFDGSSDKAVALLDKVGLFVSQKP